MGGIIVPELVHQHDSLVNRACISPYDPHPPLAGVPNINTPNHGGTETEGRRAGACGRTGIFIVGSISSAPSWCASTTVKRSRVMGQRTIGHAPAQHLCGTYMYHLLVRRGRYWWTRGKRLRAGAGNGPCTGTYTNQYRPLCSAPAESFEVHKCIFLWYICIATEGRGESAGAPAPATVHAPAGIPIKIDL